MKKSQMSKDEMELMSFLVRELAMFHEMVMLCPEPGAPGDPNADKWLKIVRDFKAAWKRPENTDRRMTEIAKRVLASVEE